ncbi:response regulator [Flavobacteriaceae bacterium F89]|uniref:Response regulator n=1 Tax=Cerina litoralis TaxID=2874477 RepID=A0AAE3JQJ2_9FLAO|nr:response regulator [Cerina litoralis]MCG2460318.1 response regulator [Cerina litoralis]
MQATKYNIHLADDDEDDLELFEDAISEVQKDAQVIKFKKGQEMISHLEDKGLNLPRIIFLDLNMPGMNGEECLIKIRDNKRLDLIPVVIYSTTFVTKVAKRLASQGANIYVQKPSSFALLKSILERSIQAAITDNP